MGKAQPFPLKEMAPQARSRSMSIPQLRNQPSCLASSFTFIIENSKSPTAGLGLCHRPPRRSLSYQDVPPIPNHRLDLHQSCPGATSKLPAAFNAARFLKKDATPSLRAVGKYNDAASSGSPLLSHLLEASASLSIFSSHPLCRLSPLPGFGEIIFFLYFVTVTRRRRSEFELSPCPRYHLVVEGQNYLFSLTLPRRQPPGQSLPEKSLPSGSYFHLSPNFGSRTDASGVRSTL